MNTPKQHNFVEHTFGPNHTINSAIRMKHDRVLSSEEMVVLQQMYNELNNFEIPKPFQTVKIPLWPPSQA